ncbi:MAG: tetratricopeptide repeat protein, partial [Deltaproteobacteria bacterium]|nr:tetratricopeptide repeat protein [Deltaproteobacteria bacterium]
AYYNLGIVMSRKGMLDQAMDAFGNVIRLDPKNPQIHNNLGIIYAQKGMFQEALGSFEKALSLDPYNADVHYNISRLFYMQKDFKSAYQYAVKAKGFGYPVPEDYLKTLR